MTQPKAGRAPHHQVWLDRSLADGWPNNSAARYGEFRLAALTCLKDFGAGRWFAGLSGGRQASWSGWRRGETRLGMVPGRHLSVRVAWHVPSGVRRAGSNEGAGRCDRYPLREPATQFQKFQRLRTHAVRIGPVFQAGPRSLGEYVLHPELPSRPAAMSIDRDEHLRQGRPAESRMRAFRSRQAVVPFCAHDMEDLRRCLPDPGPPVGHRRKCLHTGQ
jgi:hypothetical protein